jgi:multidrug efflux pump
VNNRFSEIFIRRPVATILLTIGIIFAGLLGYSQLPVSPLPQVDFPVISVQANIPGASPDTMASSVAAPLERHLGQIADVNEMTSQSTLGSTRITLQFGLDRNIDGAARDVQAAIVAARVDLPTSLRQNPTYHKVNPADAPIMVIAMSSTTRTAGQLYDLASNILQQRLSQLPGIGEVDISGAARGPAGGARRDQSRRDLPLRHRARGHSRRAGVRQRQQPEGRDRRRRLSLPGLC